MSNSTPPFEKIQLEQGTPEWHKWRSNGVGASDIGIIVGNSPYKSVLQLWEQKNNFRADDPINEHMKRGIQGEETARKSINKALHLNLEPICIQSLSTRGFFASLDGWDAKQRVLVEIKCPSAINYLKIFDSGIIPSYWLDQIQWQISLAKPEKAFIAFWDTCEERFFMRRIYSNKSYQEELHQAANHFLFYLKSGTQPPKINPIKYKPITDETLEDKFDFWNAHCEAEERSRKEKNKAKEEIISLGLSLSGNKPFSCKEFKVYKRGKSWIVQR